MGLPYDVGKNQAYLSNLGEMNSYANALIALIAFMKSRDAITLRHDALNMSGYL
jgi:hypothetical protein